MHDLMDILLEDYDDLATYEKGLPSSLASRLLLHQETLLTRSRTCEAFLYEKLPGVFSDPPARYHKDFYEHIDSLKLGKESPPFLACWPRATGKSTAGMGAVTFLAAMEQIRYVLIVSEHLANAEDRLRSLRQMFAEPSFRQSYPLVASPATNAAGHDISWRAKMLYNKAGQIFQAASLKSSNRGAQQSSQKQYDPDMPQEISRLLEVARPDLIIFDDIDNQLDGPRATERKEGIISKDIMPMGSKQYPLRVLFLQNRIIEEGVVGRILNRKDGCVAANAIISGPWPAVYELKTKPVMRVKESQGTLDISEDEIGAVILRMHGKLPPQEETKKVIEYPSHDITGGYVSWPEGMSLEKCQHLIDTMGLGEFQIEMNHITTNKEGALLSDKHFRQAPPGFDHTTLENKIVSVDPGGGATESGIIVLGNKVGEMLYEGTMTRCLLWYVVEDLSVDSKNAWEYIAVLAAARHHCDVLIEYNYGGNNLTRAAETVRDGLRDRGELSGPPPDIQSINAKENKPDRAIPFAAVYKEGRVLHVGDLKKLEREWTSTLLKKGVESPNRLDAAVNGFNYLERQTTPWGLWK